MSFPFNKFRHRLFAVTLLLISVSIPVTGFSQAKLQARQAEIEKILKIFPVQNTRAEDLVEVIGTVFQDKNDLRVSADARTNAIIAQGTPETLKELQELVKSLDEQNLSKTAVRVRVIDTQGFPELWLDDGKLISSLGQMFNLMTAGHKDLNKLMVAGPEDEIVSLEKLLETIQSSRKDAGTQKSEKLIQIFWLTTNKQEDQLSEPEANLRPVVDKLATMGFRDVGVSGQVLTRCTFGADSSSFRAEGTNATGQRLRIQGKVEPNSGVSANARASIDLNLDGTGKDAKGVTLSVVVQLVDGKPIVLGSAPLQGRQTFFVIQLLND
jgi:Bacterial type II/III secretion system short domain